MAQWSHSLLEPSEGVGQMPDKLAWLDHPSPDIEYY